MQDCDLKSVLKLVILRINEGGDHYDESMELDSLLKEFEQRITVSGKTIEWESMVVDAAKALDMDAAQAVFTLHNRIGLWGTDRESKSGFGSSRKATSVIRKRLLPLLAKLEVKHFLDAPCGDFYWASLVDWSGIEYTGMDIDHSIIESNRREHEASNVKFAAGDLSKVSLEKYDAVLCRDCLFHLPTRIAMDAIENFRNSGIRYLMSTYFPSQRHNCEVELGGWYPINLCLEPFNLPDPIERFVDDPMPLVRNIGHPVIGGLAWRLLDARSRLNSGKAARPLRFLGVWDLSQL